MKTFCKTKSLIVATLLSITHSGLTAQSNIRQFEDNKNGNVFISYFEGKGPFLGEKKSIFQSLLKMGENDSLVLLRKNRNDAEVVHEIYEQYINGYKVLNSKITIAVKNDNISSISGEFSPEWPIDYTINLNNDIALEKALKSVGAETYKWEIAEEEKLLKEQLKSSSATYRPVGELVLCKNYFSSNTAYRLAYLFDIYAHKPFGRYYVAIDAINGEVLLNNSRIHATNTTGTAATRFSGTKSITTDSFTGGYRLRETRGSSSVSIQTYNMRSAGANYGLATDFTDSDNNWTAAEFNNTNRDNAGLEVHWATEAIHDYWKNVRGMNSWNNSGGALLSYVNADLTAFGFLDQENAFWDGTRMTYGRGSTHPVTSLDIAGHKIAHAVANHLIGGTGFLNEKESGAISESLSDIWGAVVEQASVTGKQTWHLGEDVYGLNWRNLATPNATTAGQPDTYMHSSTTGHLY